MKISHRLLCIADMVSIGNRVCDIGCDHGILPLYLLKENIAPSAILVDINSKPLKRAEYNIGKYNLTDRCDFRLSNGLEKVEPLEADTIIISGLGGNTIIDIIDNGREILKYTKEIIIEPQSDACKTRQYLSQNNYKIVDEKLIKEANKYYPIIKFIYSETKQNLTDIQARYGPIIIQKKDKLLAEELNNKLTICQSVINTSNKEKIEKEIEIINKVLEQIKS